MADLSVQSFIRLIVVKGNVVVPPPDIFTKPLAVCFALMINRRLRIRHANDSIRFMIVA